MPTESRRPSTAATGVVVRHTLLTTAARDCDPATALPAFGPLLDHRHGLGAWTPVWIAVRALVETLSRLGRHRDVAVRAAGSPD